LDESSAKGILAQYAIPVPKGARVAGPDGLEAALAGLREPYVLKLVSPDALHKSEVGGVKVGLAGPAEVRAAMEAMTAGARRRSLRVEGFLVEEMAPAGKELVVGGFQDSRFGPVVMVGLGGIYVELFADVSFRICPITARDAEEMLDELRAAPLLAGMRGEPPVSRKALVDVLLRVGGERGLFLELAEGVREIDINPLIVSPTGAVAVDARLVLFPSEGSDGPG
jgi:acetyl-CoA synthetase (ADP-forming)